MWAPLPPIFGPQVFSRAIRAASTEASAASKPAPLAVRRQEEFAAGRRCAAQALLDAGSREVDVGVGAAREPLWPPGFVGSISHSSNLVAAAVAATGVVRSIGIDFEPVFDDHAMCDVVPLALTPFEKHLASRMPLREDTFATVIFSGKESLFKCLYPLVRVFFEFDDARVVALGAGGSFEIELLRTLGSEFVSGSVFEGRYAVASSLVHTAIVLRY